MTEELPEIIIPTIHIARGWDVDDVKTIQDCEDAIAYLNAAIIDLNAKLDEERDRTNSDRRQIRWWNATLRWKESALRIVETKLRLILHAERIAQKAEENRLLSLMIETHMPDFAEAAKRILGFGPELVDDIYKGSPEYLREYLKPEVKS